MTIPHRRGAIALCLIVALVVLQLVVVSAIVTGARDHDSTVQRLEAARSFYATDAAVGMALRELYLDSDEDGDGGIGTISNDNNAGNDPLFITGRASVTKTAVGSNFTLTCSGRAGDLLRTQTLTFMPGVSSGGPRRVVYSEWPSSTPQTRTWNGSMWSAASATTAMGGKQYWAVAARCPTRTETLAAYTTHSKVLQATIFNGSSWSAAQTFTSDVGTNNQRPHHAAYEAASGDALVVYRTGNNSAIYYRTWNGSSWSAQQSVSSPVSGAPRFLRLVPKPASDEMMLLILTQDNTLGAIRWTGAAWSNAAPLDSDVAVDNREAMDAAWETGTGRCMVAWGHDRSSAPQFRIWSGSAWLSVASAPSVGAEPRWIRLAADPAGSKIILACLDKNEDINVTVWSGSSWGSNLEVETNARTAARRCFDLCFTAAGTTALLAWGGNSDNPRYRTWNGSSWSAQLTGPALSDKPLIVQLRPAAAGTEILALFAVDGGQNALDFLRFNGSTFDSYQKLVSNLSGSDPDEVFMIAEDVGGSGSSAAVSGWAQVPPQ
jgi:hypothetical protein